MALTIDNFERTVFGNKKVVVCDVDFDNSYPTGGESLTPANLGLGTINFLIAEPNEGYVFEYDRANKKLLAYYGDYSNASDGALVEVPDTTDLSGVDNVRVFAFGTA